MYLASDLMAAKQDRRQRTLHDVDEVAAWAGASTDMIEAARQDNELRQVRG